MKLRLVCAAAGVAAFMVAATANAAVHRVFPGDASVIQAAIDKAKPGDTILVEPGTYTFTPGPKQAGTYYYGLRIKTDNLRLIGKEIPGQGPAGKVRLVYGLPVDPSNNVRAADVGAGVYAAPDVSLPGESRSCDPDVSDDSKLGQLCKANRVKGFYIRGFSVEGFPRNGIQTRWVNGFEFVRNTSVHNLNNGVYPTLSLNGLVQDNVSYGSLDTAMWVAGSENVRVIGNEVFGSVIGFEITVSNNVLFMQNKVYDNTVGIGLFHPNGAGNPPTSVSALNNWVIEHNDVRNNNLPNAWDVLVPLLPPGQKPPFQAALPSGIGILLAGVSTHTISKNTVEGNGYVGIAVLGWCLANAASPNNNCQANQPIAPPDASDNTVALNKVGGNGTSPPPLPPELLALAADITYAEVEGSSGNCFEKNKPGNFTYVSTDGQLPTDGCKKP